MKSFLLSVRKIGGDPVNLNILDDTGSSYMELYQIDDLDLLGVDGAYGYWGAGAQLAAANGVVWRDTLLMEMNIMDNDGVFMTTWRRMWCCVTPGISFGNPRCSGMFVRKSLYTGTVPDGLGVLYIAAKKAGLCSQMPAV